MTSVYITYPAGTSKRKSMKPSLLRDDVIAQDPTFLVAIAAGLYAQRIISLASEVGDKGAQFKDTRPFSEPQFPESQLRSVIEEASLKTRLQNPS
jgi:hypothetical protein